MANQNEEVTVQSTVESTTTETVQPAATEVAKDSYSYGPTVSTIFFFLVFCYVIYTVFKKGSSKKFDHYSKIPLEENDKPKQ